MNEELAEASARWPGVALSHASFLRYLEEHHKAAGGLDAALPRLAIQDLYLARACAIGDARAQIYFDQQYLARVPLFVAQLRLTAAQVQDLQLALRERLLFGASVAARRISGYQGKGPLQAFVRVAATRAALTLLRSKQQHSDELDEDVHGPYADDPEARESDPELEYLRRCYLGPFTDALRSAFAAISAKERCVLRQYYVSGLNTRKIAAVHNVAATTASRWVAAARAHLGALVRARIRAHLTVSNREARVLLRAFQSRLDLNLDHALAD